MIDLLTRKSVIKEKPTAVTKEPAVLSDFFVFAAEKHPRPDALNYKKDDRWQHISSNEMLSRIENIALGLYSLGLRKGDRAAILSANSPEWTLTDAACQFAGIIDVPIYTTLAEDGVSYIINDSSAKIFFLQDLETYERLVSIFPECPTIEKTVFFDGEKSGEKFLTLAELEKSGEKLKSEKPSLINALRNAVTPADVATLIYTSGTTGEPKGVMLMQSNIVSNVQNVSRILRFEKSDLALSVLPLSHVFERGAMYLYICGGMAVYYAESIEKVPDNLREIQPTIFVAVPRIFEKVYQKAKLKAAGEGRITEMLFDWAIDVAKEYARLICGGQPVSSLLAVKHGIADRIVFSKFREFFGGKLKACITGGAALSDEIFYIFTGAGITILQGYGLTETSPVITTNTPQATRAGTVGKPIPQSKVRFAEDGEIEVKGPNVMVGYYNKPDATKEVFTSDGWFKTGDIGEIDKDGFLTITDRKKELFKTSGGKYIAPAPIEQMIKHSPYVNQVVLVGNERKFPAALIVPDFESLKNYAKKEGINAETPGDFCSSEQIKRLIERQINDLTAKLSKYEKVKKIALLEKEFSVKDGEMTPTLKIKRRVIYEKYKDVIDKIYEDAETEKR